MFSKGLIGRVERGEHKKINKGEIKGEIKKRDKQFLWRTNISEHEDVNGNMKYKRILKKR